MAGELGPEIKDCSMVIEVERERLKEGLREDGFDGPIAPEVPLRGCDWRILRSPESPNP